MKPKKVVWNNLPIRKRWEIISKGRITVGKISQYINRSFVNFYVGKVGGMIMSNESKQFKFKSVELAKHCAINARESARKMLCEHP